MLVASWSVSPRFGMTVPGFKPGGFMIQAFSSLGPLLGTTPPAMVVRDATPARFGPIVPFAPGMPGMVWQAGHPFCWMSCAPSVGSPVLAAAGGGFVPGAGAGALPGDAAGLGTGAGAGPAPLACCCSQTWKSASDCVVTRNCIPLWPDPH